eukprot:364830-Chlamydomonas_euryale.AAC.9
MTLVPAVLPEHLIVEPVLLQGWHAGRDCAQRNGRLQENNNRLNHSNSSTVKLATGDLMGVAKREGQQKNSSLFEYSIFRNDAGVQQREPLRGPWSLTAAAATLQQLLQCKCQSMHAYTTYVYPALTLMRLMKPARSDLRPRGDHDGGRPTQQLDRWPHSCLRTNTHIHRPPRSPENGKRTRLTRQWRQHVCNGRSSDLQAAFAPFGCHVHGCSLSTDPLAQLRVPWSTSTRTRTARRVSAAMQSGICRHGWRTTASRLLSCSTGIAEHKGTPHACARTRDFANHRPSPTAPSIANARKSIDVVKVLSTPARTWAQWREQPPQKTACCMALESELPGSLTDAGDSETSHYYDASPAFDPTGDTRGDHSRCAFCLKRAE